MKKLFVIGMAVLLLVVFTMPAMAKVKIGGIVFTDFYYLDRNTANAGAGATDSLTITTIEVPSITRLYGRWTNEDNVGMYIEFGIGGGGGATGVSVRHAYGWWDVNPMFQIMAGHSTTPFSPLNPSQLLGTQSGSLNIIGVGYGDFYSGRFPQVRGTFKFGKVARLEIALVDPNGGAFGPWGTFQTEEYVGVDPVTKLPTTMTRDVWVPSGQNNTKIPRIDISVPIYAGPVHIYPGFIYQHRTADNVTPAGTDNSLNTYIGSLGLKAGFGPFGIACEGNYGKNWGNTRGLFGNSPSAILAGAVLKNNGQINDAETYSFWLDLSYKFGPITPHLIYGQQKTKNENAAGAKMEARTSMIGFSVPIDLAKGFRIRPEFMWYDDGDTSTAGAASVKNGRYSIYGVQFQITF